MRTMHLSLLAAVAVLAAAHAPAAETLPWEKDYKTALVKAKAEKRPVFLMLTATWCGPCKMLERQTLPDANIRSGLHEFVWVQAFEDADLNKRFQCGGYPTLVFLEPETERVLAHSTGYRPPDTFLQLVIEARKAAKLPLTKTMQDLLARHFEIDYKKLAASVEAGDMKALTNYLAPLSNDSLRACNYRVVKLHLPEGVKPADVLFPGEGEPLVPRSGLLMLPTPRGATNAPATILVPGVARLTEPFPLPSNAAVAAREITVTPLTANEAASFTGRVLLPDGKPAAKAIVRICDWTVTRTDNDGRFALSRVAPGAFTVRAECPGGEFQEQLTFEAGKELKRDLPLTAVTTVGIRWALQLQEGSRELAGEGVRTGEAYFSVKHGRFLLSRGAEVPEYWGSDFMLETDLGRVRQYMPAEKIAAIEAAPAGTPFFWLFDASDRVTGLHAEQVPFEEITAVNGGKPYQDKEYFKFLRGDLLRPGQVYTLRCVRKDRYAKMEITELTLGPATKAKAAE